MELQKGRTMTRTQEWKDGSQTPVAIDREIALISVRGFARIFECSSFHKPFVPKVLSRQLRPHADYARRRNDGCKSEHHCDVWRNFGKRCVIEDQAKVRVHCP